MSILTQLTTTAAEAVETVRTKAAAAVIDVRKQLPTAEAKKVQTAVIETVGSARKQASKQVIDLTVRGEQLVRTITGRPATRKPRATTKPASLTLTVTAPKPATKRATKPATKRATKPAVKRATKPAVKATVTVKAAAKRPAVKVTARKTAVKRTAKKATSTTK